MGTDNLSLWVPMAPGQTCSGDEREEYTPAKLFVAHLSISQVKQFVFLPPAPTTHPAQGAPPPARAALTVHKRQNNCPD